MEYPFSGMNAVHSAKRLRARSRVPNPTKTNTRDLDRRDRRSTHDDGNAGDRSAPVSHSPPGSAVRTLRSIAAVAARNCDCHASASATQTRHPSEIARTEVATSTRVYLSAWNGATPVEIAVIPSANGIDDEGRLCRTSTAANQLKGVAPDGNRRATVKPVAVGLSADDPKHHADQPSMPTRRWPSATRHLEALGTIRVAASSCGMAAVSLSTTPPISPH